jgi:hypothetical protein
LLLGGRTVNLITAQNTIGSKRPASTILPLTIDHRNNDSCTHRLSGVEQTCLNFVALQMLADQFPETILANPSQQIGFTSAKSHLNRLIDTGTRGDRGKPAAINDFSRRWMGLTFDGHVNKGWSDHDNLRNPFCHIILPVTIRFKYYYILLHVFSLEKGFLPILQSCHLAPFTCNWQSSHPDWHRVTSEEG